MNFSLAKKVSKCMVLYRQIHISFSRQGCGSLEQSANGRLSKHIADKYLCLPMPECMTVAEYIWIDGSGQDIRSKVRTIDFVPQCVEEFPKWIFNGQYTHQEFSDKNNDMILVPAAVYNDPFRRGNNKLVLCEVYTPEKKPASTNFRAGCSTALKAACHAEPWFGVEQEFAFMDVDGVPFGWPRPNGEPSPLGSYFCAMGASKVFGRDIMECIYRASLYAGITFHSAHAGFWPAMWSYSTGPTAGIKAADDIWMARFIMKRIAEEFGLDISYQPKLYKNWHGSAANFNFSTKPMREEGGIKHIEDAICRLSKRHMEHLVKYDPRGGMDNVKRLTGKHDTTIIHEFSHGVAMRSCGIRLTEKTVGLGFGCLQDRRPAANCDAYAVIEAIIRTVVIDDV